LTAPRAAGSTPDTDINELVLSLYDTVLAPECWPVVLQRVAGFVGGAGAVIFERPDGEAGRGVRASYLSADHDARALEAYLARFADHELDDQLLFERTSMLSDRVELVSDEAVSRDGAPLSTRPNARFLRAFGLRNRAAALLDKDDPSRDRFSVQSAAARGPITPAEIARASLILAHVAKALAIARPFRELRESRTIALSSLDRLRVGVAITDHGGRPIFENNEFRRIADDSGTIGRDRAGRLALRETRAQAKLTSLLGDIDGHGRFGARPRKEAVIVDRGGDTVSGLCVEIWPLARADEVSAAPFDGYLVTCLDTRATFDLDLAAMSRAFQLTNAEERVLGHVTTGQSNAQIAQLSSRSVETVNSQVKALLGKTGCENRTQLVRLAVALGQRVTTDGMSHGHTPGKPGRATP
jgi:DNA-binding CsgD family transcriptional regulator